MWVLSRPPGLSGEFDPVGRASTKLQNLMKPSRFPLGNGHDCSRARHPEVTSSVIDAKSGGGTEALRTQGRHLAGDRRG